MPCVLATRYWTVPSDGAVEDTLGGSPNAVSIGRSPSYKDDALVNGARVFDLPADSLDAMIARTDKFGGTGPGSEFWIRNTGFLDNAVVKNSAGRMTSDPLDPDNFGSIFLR